MNMGILVLLLAIILFAVLAFKQISALILAPLVTIFVLIFSALFAGNSVAILSGLKNDFMPAAAGYVSSYFLVFFVGALFGAVYQFTGAAKSVAKWLSGMSRGQFVAPIIMMITGILTYGGISGFVVFFVVYPIALQMFRNANVTRRLIPAAISAGCWTWSMYGPGSPSIQNVIPIDILGTTPTAALVPSILITVLSFVLIFVWLECRARSFTKKGCVFHDPTLRTQLTPEELQADEDESLPNPIVALIPIVVILVLFNAPILLKDDGTRGGLPVETSVFLGVVLACILFFPRIEGGLNGWIRVFNKGAADSGVSILNTAIVVGFGGVPEEPGHEPSAFRYDHRGCLRRRLRLRLRRYGRGLQCPEGYLRLSGRASALCPPHRRHCRRHAGLSASPGRADHPAGYLQADPQRSLL